GRAGPANQGKPPRHACCAACRKRTSFFRFRRWASFTMYCSGKAADREKKQEPSSWNGGIRSPSSKAPPPCSSPHWTSRSIIGYRFGTASSCRRRPRRGGAPCRPETPRAGFSGGGGLAPHPPPGPPPPPPPRGAPPPRGESSPPPR